MQIDGSAALVAGGASGLGEATARTLHSRGARIVIADMNPPRGQALADELGERVSFVRADVSDPDSMAVAVDVATALPGAGADRHGRVRRLHQHRIDRRV